MTGHGLKEFAQTKAPKFGHFIVEFATPGIGHILKSAGCDFVLFDLEHSGFGFETVKSAIRYFEAADLPVIVRVRPLRRRLRHGRCGGLHTGGDRARHHAGRRAPAGGGFDHHVHPGPQQ